MFADNYIEYYNKSAGLPTELHACCGHPGRPGQSLDIFASEARSLYGTFMPDIDEYLQGAAPVDYVALVISEETRYRWPHYDRTQYRTAMKELFAHYFDRSTTLSFLLNLDLPSADLGRFKLVVMLETSGLAAAEADALESYAHSGGKLLLVGGAGLFDAAGAPRSDYQLAAAQGLRWTRRHCEPSVGETVSTSAPPVVHPATFCCVEGPRGCSGDGNFTLVENVSLAQCGKACAHLSCPCYDYSPVPPHPVQRQCRVVAKGYPFHLDRTHPYTTAYTTVPVPPPPPPLPSPPPPPTPPPPPPPPTCIELATSTTAAPSANKSGLGHPLFYTNTLGQDGVVITVMLDAVSTSGAGPSPPQLMSMLLKHVSLLAGHPPLEVAVGGDGTASADVVLRVQNDTGSGPRWMLHFMTDKRLVVELNPQYIAASRIVWQYPGAGWNCSLVGSTLNVNPGVGVRGRLVALKSDDDRNDVQGPQCQPRQINPYMPLYHSK